MILEEIEPLSSLIPMLSSLSDSLFYPGEILGTVSSPKPCDDLDSHSEVILFCGNVSLESLLVCIKSLETKVCHNRGILQLLESWSCSNSASSQE